jgi:hypothetical protein
LRRRGEQRREGEVGPGGESAVVDVTERIAPLLERRSDPLRDELDRDNHAVDEERGHEQPSRDAMVRNAGVPGSRRRDDEASGDGRAT